MTKNGTPTPVYLDPGMHPGLEVKGLRDCNMTGSDIHITVYRQTECFIRHKHYKHDELIMKR